jgi:hypothetical protein
MRVHETVSGWLKRNQLGSSFSSQHIPDPYTSSNVIDMQAWAHARTLRNLDAADRHCAFVHGEEIAEYRRWVRNGAKSTRQKSARPLETAFDLLQRVTSAIRATKRAVTQRHARFGDGTRRPLATKPTPSRQ